MQKKDYVLWYVTKRKIYGGSLLLMGGAPFLITSPPRRNTQSHI